MCINLEQNILRYVVLKNKILLIVTVTGAGGHHSTKYQLSQTQNNNNTLVGVNPEDEAVDF